MKMKTKIIFLLTLLCGTAVFMTVKADPEPDPDPDPDADANAAPTRYGSYKHYGYG